MAKTPAPAKELRELAPPVELATALLDEREADPEAEEPVADPEDDPEALAVVLPVVLAVVVLVVTDPLSDFVEVVAAGEKNG